jgi:hypothetical protein
MPRRSSLHLGEYIRELLMWCRKCRISLCVQPPRMRTKAEASMAVIRVARSCASTDFLCLAMAQSSLLVLGVRDGISSIVVLSEPIALPWSVVRVGCQACS